MGIVISALKDRERLAAELRVSQELARDRTEAYLRFLTDVLCEVRRG